MVFQQNLGTVSKTAFFQLMLNIFSVVNNPTRVYVHPGTSPLPSIILFTTRVKAHP